MPLKLVIKVYDFEIKIDQDQFNLKKNELPMTMQKSRIY